MPVTPAHGSPLPAAVGRGRLPRPAVAHVNPAAALLAERTERFVSFHSLPAGVYTGRVIATRPGTAAVRHRRPCPWSLLQIRRVAQTHDDAPVEYRVSHVNTSRHEYRAEIGRASPAAPGP